jgi:hypothetical protein
LQTLSGWIAEQIVTTVAVVVAPSVMMRRTLFDWIQGFDEAYVLFEDYELWTRCALASPVTVVSKELVLVRDHPGTTPRGAWNGMTTGCGTIATACRPTVR